MTHLFDSRPSDSLFSSSRSVVVFHLFANKVHILISQISALYSEFDLNWPSALQTVLKAFSAVNLNLEVAQPECSLNAEIGFYQVGLSMTTFHKLHFNDWASAILKIEIFTLFLIIIINLVLCNEASSSSSCTILHICCVYHCESSIRWPWNVKVCVLHIWQYKMSNL